MRCQDTYLYARSWIYEQSLICYFLNIVLVYLSSVDRRDRGRDRAGQIGGHGVCRAGQRAEFSKNRGAARRKNFFCALFLIFFKKLFRVQNLCFRLFSPVLRTTTRACVFIIFEKKQSEKFF